MGKEFIKIQIVFVLKMNSFFYGVIWPRFLHIR